MENNTITGWLVYSCVKKPVPRRKGYVYHTPFKFFKTEEEANNYIKNKNGKL